MQIEGVVADSGEGRWTVMQAVEERVTATFAEKVLSAMRHKFGGHVEPPAGG